MDHSKITKKKIIVLGSTGSIGRNTLDVISSFSNLFQVEALSCKNSLYQLIEQIDEYYPKAVAITGLDRDEYLKIIKQEPPKKIHVYFGYDGLLTMIEEVNADIVVNGISGAAGLKASVKSIESGKHLALANKETMVMAGELVISMANKNQRRLLPVDSEHSAILNLTNKIPSSEIEEIILTASGGAFRDLSVESMKHVTAEDALKHPTWEMGKKITIDSASMANKGLEVIEAQQLFGIETAKIKVVIHPESMVHSLVRTRDGVLYAQISQPDMRTPILHALSYPEIPQSKFGRLDISNLALNFKEPDMKKYKMLELAYKAAELGNAYRVAYNAANEIVVKYFLAGQIGFLDIPEIVERILSLGWVSQPMVLESIIELDEEVRIKTEEIILGKI